MKEVSFKCGWERSEIEAGDSFFRVEVGLNEELKLLCAYSSHFCETGFADFYIVLKACLARRGKKTCVCTP